VPISQAKPIGYSCRVTPMVQDHSLTHLTAAEARLSALLSRPAVMAWGCVVLLTALGWAAIGLLSANEAGGAWSWQALCRPARGAASLAVVLPMWGAMTLAMMLPTAGPMIVTYAEIADTAARKHEHAVSPLVLAAGYLAVWFGFAVAVALLQWTLARAGWLDGGTTGSRMGGLLFIGAGLYQFTPVKRACLSQCQRPFPFFFANWTEERTGVFRLGLRQGVYCLGCCWATMLLMFATGAMNVVWMAALGILMTVEKIVTSPGLSRAAGAVFIVIGVAMAAGAGFQGEASRWT